MSRRRLILSITAGVVCAGLSFPALHLIRRHRAGLQSTKALGIHDAFAQYYVNRRTFPSSWEELEAGAKRDLSRERGALDIQFEQLNARMMAWLEQNRYRDRLSEPVPVFVRYKRSFWIESRSQREEQQKEQSLNYILLSWVMEHYRQLAPP